MNGQDSRPLWQNSCEIFTNTYGGKRSFLRTLFFSAKAWLGGYSCYRRINWSIVKRVIFVCHGNICRSPYAEIKYRMMGGCAISAGLEAKTGSQANARAQKVASARGVQLDSHRSTHINDVSLDSGDLFVAFEPGHATVLHNRIRNQHGIQVTLLGLWSLRSYSIYMHDPYGLPEKYFARCFSRIDLALEKMHQHLEAVRSRN